jgi:hypothetical protein
MCRRSCRLKKTLARLTDQIHMWSMSGRPCNPGSDFKSLWRAFLGDMPMPQCGALSEAEPAEDPKAAKADPARSDRASARPAANTTRDR